MAKITNPRYNVLSFRVSDDELAEIREVIPGGSTRQDFLLQAILEQVRQEQETAYRERVNAALR